MSLARSRINHDLLHVRRRQGFEDRSEVSFVAPIGEALIDMVPLAKGRWQIAPRRAGLAKPKDGVDELSLIAARTALARRDARLDEGPFFIGQCVSVGHGVIVAHLSQQPLRQRPAINLKLAFVFSYFNLQEKHAKQTGQIQPLCNSLSLIFSLILPLFRPS